MTTVKDILERADHYRLRVHRKRRAHYLAAKLAHSRHMGLGVPVVVTTTVVGTTIFATLSKAPELGWRIAAGLVSIAAAVMAALQTFFRYAEASEKHRVSAANYAALFRKFDLFLLRYRDSSSSDADKALDELTVLTEAWNHLEETALDVPDSLYDKAVEESKSDQEGI